MSRRAARLFVLALALALPAAWASSGVVIDPQGNPIDNVRVCYMQGNVETLCALTEADGTWSIPDSVLDTVRLSHEAFLPRVVGGGKQPEPVKLEPAAILIVRLEDRSGRAINSGEVDVLMSSGVRFGPFPIETEKGTIVNSLDPGPVVILARSEGFAETRAAEDELPAGQKTTVVVRLERASEKDQ